MLAVIDYVAETETTSFVDENIEEENLRPGQATAAAS
jgi:hypothetical protein